jgi:hypothetical protein
MVHGCCLCIIPGYYLTFDAIQSELRRLPLNRKKRINMRLLNTYIELWTYGWNFRGHIKILFVWLLYWNEAPKFVQVCMRESVSLYVWCVHSERGIFPGGFRFLHSTVQQTVLVSQLNNLFGVFFVERMFFSLYWDWKWYSLFFPELWNA